MNVTSMIADFALGTSRRERKKASALKNLALGRAKRTENAGRRRAELPGLVASGMTCKQIAERYKVELMTIRNEIREAVKAGEITAEQAKSALPPIKNQRDRVYKRAHDKSIKLRDRIVEFVGEKQHGPATMKEIAAHFGLSRSAILAHIEALEVEGRTCRLNTTPYKIAPKQPGKDKKC